MIRALDEGSTIVMKAINANSVKALKKALTTAPRADRSTWLLRIEVGNQTISPLAWAIESGMFEVATAILQDLLSFRADRDRCYYGVDDLFLRHPDLIKRLCDDAPPLLPSLLEGLVWRSRTTKNGLRRVNYYIKHLLVDRNGEVSQALSWLVASKDVKIISHPVIVVVSDTFWMGVVRRQFIVSKIWFILSLVTFMMSQAILPKLTMLPHAAGDIEDSRDLRWTIFVGRCLTYIFSMGQLLRGHATKILRAFYGGDIRFFALIPIPRYLLDKSAGASFCLMALLVAMCLNEPMFYCMGEEAWPTEICEKSAPIEFLYSVLSMSAMIFLWMLVVDMAVFSTKISAFVLVCVHVFTEVGRFLVALFFLLLTFASAISVLHTTHDEFRDVPTTMLSLFAVTVGIYEKDYREIEHESVLLTAVFFFVAVSAILLLNLLIVQLNCSYEFVYQDMVGFARMNRAELIVDMLASCSEASWRRFVKTLRLDQPLEFDEGDVGLPGGTTVKEPAGKHPVLVDYIARYGGNTSGDMPWPEDGAAMEQDRLKRLEALLSKALKQAMRLRRGEMADHDGGANMSAKFSSFGSEA